ncbi:MAG: hypothetical protein Q9220_004464 [cf. Caloplaca sp. 1 TL-2023]
MSTIASPRPSSTTSVSSSPSLRPSLDHHAARSSATSPAPAPTTRRNKTALRDYYGLKAAAAANASQESHPPPDSEPSPTASQTNTELDAPGFNAENYVQRLLETENLAGILKVEKGLIDEIRALDGEKKALVYDNYSKLIGATDTIRKMRSNMDPLTPSTSTLAPAISHIAETAASLAKTVPNSNITEAIADDEARVKKQRQKETVRWVLAAPDRLKKLVAEGRREEAIADWAEVQRLLEKWKGVQGTEEVRDQCSEVMTTESTKDEG